MNSFGKSPEVSSGSRVEREQFLFYRDETGTSTEAICVGIVAPLTDDTKRAIEG